MLFTNNGQIAANKNIIVNISKLSGSNGSYTGPRVTIALLNSSTDAEGIATFFVNSTISSAMTKYQYGWNLEHRNSVDHLNFRDLSYMSSNSSHVVYFMNSILDDSSQGHYGASLLVSYLSANHTNSGPVEVFYQYYNGSLNSGNFSQSWNYLGTFADFTTVKVGLQSVPAGENLYNIRVVTPSGNFTHWYSEKPIS